VDLLCGDFAELPLGPNSLDLVWSNLALHWHPQPDRVFAEWRRVLRVNSLLMFSCFGPDSLREVRNAFAEADLAPHVLPFVDMHDFGDQLVEAGFPPRCWTWKPSPSPTIRRKRCWPTCARWVAIRSRRCAAQHDGQAGLAAHAGALERGRRSDGKLGLTFEVIYGHAFRPAPGHFKGRPLSVSIRRASRAKRDFMLPCGVPPWQQPSCEIDYFLMWLVFVLYNHSLILPACHVASYKPATPGKSGYIEHERAVELSRIERRRCSAAGCGPGWRQLFKERRRFSSPISR
jgi:hypothetical protein